MCFKIEFDVIDMLACYLSFSVTILVQAVFSMHRFMSSLASSSSGRAEQPASASSSSLLRSAEQPATPSHLKISSIRDVQRWMAKEPIASCSTADAQRIREAVSVLSRSKPRKEDVRPLQSKWQVAQKTTKTRDR